MRFMKTSLLLVVVLFSTSCARNQVVTSPTYKANQVAIRINELSKTVIDLNKVGQIPDDKTRAFGTWAVVALKTLQDVPNGWEKTIQTGWNAAKTNLPTSNVTITTLVTVVDALVDLLNPPPGV